jgi:hypothetical protein
MPCHAGPRSGIHSLGSMFYVLKPRCIDAEQDIENPDVTGRSKMPGCKAREDEGMRRTFCTPQ